MKKKKILQWVIGITLITGVSLLMVFVYMFANQHDFKFQKGENINLKKPIKDAEGQIQTELYGHDKQIITKEEPYLLFVNAPNNQVYFQYDVMNGDKILEKTDLFQPNSMVKINLYSKLKKGSYKLDLVLKTYDVETLTANNSVTEQVLVEVK